MGIGSILGADGEGGLVRIVEGTLVTALMAAVMGHTSGSAKAEVFNFPEGTPFSTIQSAASDPANEVYLGEGTFVVPYGGNFGIRAKTKKHY